MEKIAIIGMSCLFPDASDPNEFYSSLLDGKCSVDVPLNLSANEQSIYFERYFDNYPGLDDIFYLTFDVVERALIDAELLGSKELHRAGLLVGQSSTVTEKSRALFDDIYDVGLKRVVSDPRVQALHGSKSYSPRDSNSSPLNAICVSYPTIMAADLYGLGSVSFTFDAACASALYGIKLASHYLDEKIADIMIVGGTYTYGYSTINSNLGSLNVAAGINDFKPLDKSSKGTIASEGAGMFVLERLSDAVKRKRKIHAVISGIGWSGDGNSKFILSPEHDGQIRAYQDAYRQRQRNVDYIECHATGTPVGDQVELDALESYFKNIDPLPRIGAVKANTGHFMAASSCASLIKVVMSMKRGEIPATIRVNDPLESKDGVFGKELIVTKNSPWASANERKSAGINAFGFGGINAHLVVEEYLPDGPLNFSTKQQYKDQDMGIVGIGVRFGDVDSISKLSRTLYHGGDIRRPIPKHRWAGLNGRTVLMEKLGFASGRAPDAGYIDSIRAELKKYKLYPNTKTNLMMKDLIMLQVVDSALKDAGYRRGGKKNIAVLMATELDLTGHRTLNQNLLKEYLQKNAVDHHGGLSGDVKRTLSELPENALYVNASAESVITGVGSMVASRIAVDWDLTGPVMKISSLENSVPKAIQVASFLLKTASVEAVVLGAYGMTCEIENTYWFQSLGKDIGITFGEGEFPTDGFGAVILKSFASAQQCGERIYASIESIRFSNKRNKKTLKYRAPCAEDIRSLIDKTTNRSSLEERSIGLVDSFGPPGQRPLYQLVDKERSLPLAATDSQLAVGSVATKLGYSEAATAMASLIKACLCMYYQFKPLDDLPGQPLDASVNSVPGYWSGSEGRYSLVIGDGLDQCLSLILLKDVKDKINLEKFPTTDFDFSLIPIPFDLDEKDSSGLREQLQLLAENLSSRKPLDQIAAEYYLEFSDSRETSSQHRVLVLIGSTKKELESEARLASNFILGGKILDSNFETPRGSYCAINPLGGKSKIALMLPPFGVSDGSRIHDYLVAFPELLYSANKLDGVSGSHPDTISGLIADYIFRERLKIKPSVFAGCSMGEISMALVTGFISPNDSHVPDPGKTSSSSLFTGDDVIREFGLKDPSEWASYLVYYDTNMLNESLRDIDSVYVTVIGSGKVAFIAGSDAECRKLIGKLECFSKRIPARTYAHTPLAEADFDRVLAFIKSKNFKISNEGSDFEIYSSYTRKPVEKNFDEYCFNLAKMLCSPIDMPKLFRSICADGVKYFIDVGTKEFCGSLLKDTLDETQAVSISLNSSGKTFGHSLAILSGKLLSHGVGIDITSFFDLESVNSEKPGFSQKIENGYMKEGGFEFFADVEDTSLGLEWRWSRETLISMTKGGISKYFGEQFKRVDEYPIRARLALPPFMFISEVLSIQGVVGETKPSRMEFKYTIPDDGLFFHHNVASAIHLNEISQSGLFLMSYIGIDLELNGEFHYRGLGSRAIRHNKSELSPGDILYVSYSIDSISEFRGQIVVRYTVEVSSKGIHQMTYWGAGGFFSKEAINSSDGILESSEDGRTMPDSVGLPDRVRVRTSKRCFSSTDVAALQQGKPRECFGGSFPIKCIDLQLYPPALKMLDRVVMVDPTGGLARVGSIESEADIQPDHWAFDVHFINDPVLPATLIIEGATQTVLFYLTFLGLRELNSTTLQSYESIPSIESESKARGQVPRKATTLRYVLEVKSIRTEPVRIFYDFDVFSEDKRIMKYINASLILY